MPAPVATADFIAAMRRTVAAVSVVTTDGAAGRFGVTVRAVSSVSAEPPMMLCCIHHLSPACAPLEKNGVFCVNLLSEKQSEVSRVFAGQSAVPGEHGKFDCAEWGVLVTGAPVLVEMLSAFDCTLVGRHDYGTHALFVGRVEAVREGAGMPLLYGRQSYGKPELWF